MAAVAPLEVQNGPTQTTARNPHSLGESESPVSAGFRVKTASRS
jgi:hypothetical protein